MVGFRIKERQHKNVDNEIFAQLRKLGTAQVSDVMARLYGVVGLQAMHDLGQEVMVGQALTVKTRPFDNLMIHKAIALAQPDEVLVVDGGGLTENALVGELMALEAQNRQIAGFVIDGAIRDKDYFETHRFACFARGVSHRGPYKDGPGEIGVPVSIGGQVVLAGDVVMGDADGIVVIPLDCLEEVTQAAWNKEQAELATKEKLRTDSYVKTWIDTTIEKRKKEF